MLIKYEKSKLFDYRFRMVLIILFFAYLFITAIDIVSDTSYKKTYGISKIEALYENYQLSPSEVDSAYEELNMQIQFMDENNAPAVLKDELFNEYALYIKLYEDIKRDDNYHGEIQNVIKKASRTLLTYNIENIGAERQEYQLQEKVLDIYSIADKSVKIEFEYLCGWNNYFSDVNYSGYLYLAIIFYLIISFFNDKSTKNYEIIQTTRKGRSETSVSKIFLHFSVIAISIFAGELLRLGTVYIYYGLSSPFNNIQAFEMFSLYPYNISIMEYLLIYILLKLLMCISLYLIFLTTLCVVRNIIIFIPIYIGYLGFNSFIYNLGTNNLSTNTVFNINTAISRYRPIYILNHTYANDIIIPIMLVLEIILLTPLIINLYTCKDIKIAKLRTAPKMRETKNVRARNYSLNCTYHEIYKQLICNKMYLIVMLGIIFIGLYQYSLCEAKNTYMDSVYKYYISVFGGKYTSDTVKHLDEEEYRLAVIIADEDTMGEMFQSGNITLTEYSDYINELLKAKTHIYVLYRLKAKADYFDNIETKYAESGEYILYETGYELLFDNSSAVILCLVTIIMASFSYSMEYQKSSSSDKMITIIHSTKINGRGLYLSKLLSLLYINTGFILISFLLRFFVISHYFDYEYFNAYIFSLTTFKNIIIPIPLIGLICIYIIITLIIYNSILIFHINAARMLKNTMLSLSCGVLLLISAFFRRMFSAQFMENIDITTITTPKNFMNILIGDYSQIPMEIVIILLGVISIGCIKKTNWTNYYDIKY